MKRLLLIIIFTSIILGACNTKEEAGKEDQKEIYILAAASLTDVLDELKADYEAEHGVDITYVYGGSGKLAQQIEQGAPADVFISANEAWMDDLEEKYLIEKATRKHVTGNKLMLITHQDATFDYTDFDDIKADDLKQIAIGNPESVPAGDYTETVLKSLGKWDELADKFVFAQDVRQVLTYVETGNADIGFVYESDTIDASDILVLAAADMTKHEPIIYPAAVVQSSVHEAEAVQFIDYLQSEKGQKVLQKYGFHMPK